MTLAARRSLATGLSPSILARHAVASLHAELVLSPKPGLVCTDDRGSHDDMDASTMMRSLFALRHGFVAIARAAARGAAFDRLQAIGIDAERAMRRATQDVNTHRGALFTLGLLVAAAACCDARDGSITVPMLRDTLRERWGRALRARPVDESSHGLAMAARHGAGGARREAAEGMPGVFDVTLPALQAARAAGHDERAARLHALMTSIARIDDTNLLYRGGRAGLHDVQTMAREFLDSGGVALSDHEATLRGIAVVSSRVASAPVAVPTCSRPRCSSTLFVDARRRRSSSIV